MFLAGEEEPERDSTLDWKAMMFTAAMGARAATFIDAAQGRSVHKLQTPRVLGQPTVSQGRQKWTNAEARRSRRKVG